MLGFWVRRRGSGRRPSVGRLAGSVALLACASAAVPGGASGAPGDLDPGFGGTAHGRVVFHVAHQATLTGLAVQRRGGIITVGHAEGTVAFDAVAARLHPDGTRDHRFGTVTLPGRTDGTEAAWGAVAQPGGKILVVGQVSHNGAGADAAVWRLKPSGALDKSFGRHGLAQVGTAGADEIAFAATVDGQGRIVLAGSSGSAGPNGVDVAVARLTARGMIDPSFNQGSPFVLPHPGNDQAFAVAVRPDGKIVLGSTYSGASGNAVLRINPGSATTPATFDSHFGVDVVPGATGTTFPAVAMTRRGQILVLDQVPSSTRPGRSDATVVRLTRSGTVDPSFGSAQGARIVIPGSTTTATALTLLPHQGVAVIGMNDAGAAFVAKFRSNGRPDRHMGPRGVKVLRVHTDLVTVAASSDGRIIAAGNVPARFKNVVYRLRGDLRPPTCRGRRSTIVGTKAADQLVGTRHADVIAGLGGADSITGLGRNDVICGGPGRDHLVGGAGNDMLFGGPGRDSLRGGPGRDDLTQ